MFTPKSRQTESASFQASPGATIISSGTTLDGDLTSTGDVRIDGIVNGNINCTAKLIIGSQGAVNGDLISNHADIMGRVTGNINVREMLQLKSGSHVTGNIQASRLQIEANANFNGQCQMEQEITADEAGKSKSAVRVA